eukprot:jgi/Mesvir1/16780/Mv15152-RA.1
MVNFHVGPIALSAIAAFIIFHTSTSICALRKEGFKCKTSPPDWKCFWTKWGVMILGISDRDCKDKASTKINGVFGGVAGTLATAAVAVFGINRLMRRRSQPVVVDPARQPQRPYSSPMRQQYRGRY